MDYGSVKDNRLLAQLPSEEYEEIVARMCRIELPAGQIVCEPGKPMPFVLFPVTGMLSSVVVLEDGDHAESATIGNEGMVGVAALVDDYASPYQVIQRVGGTVLRIPTGQFRALVDASPALRELVGRYVLALLQQHSQNAACNLHHTIDKRMCRWLLTTSDRVGGDGFQITQESLSEMLGVSRQSVNTAAGELQQAGLISYSRGKLRITDRPRLEQAACECYRVSREAYDRLMRMTAAV